MRREILPGNLPFTGGEAFTIIPKRYEDTDAGWVYSSGISSWTDSNLSGGSAHYSNVIGKYAEFAFDGSQVILTYTGFNNRGTLDVYLDGNPVKIATINEYSLLTTRRIQNDVDKRRFQAASQ